MAEYSERDAQYAEQIIDQLMSSNEERSDLSLDTEVDISILDLEQDTARFINELQFAEDIGANIPAVRIGGEYLVPISLNTIYELPFPFNRLSRRRRSWRESFIFDFYYRDFRYLLEEYSERVGSITPDRARTTFRQRAVEFLATRVSAVRNIRQRGSEAAWTGLSYLTLPQRWLVGKQIFAPGCQFNVSANSNGLRVFWSGAYWVSSNYFGHPTSPASSVLQAGTYIFGVDGGAYGSNIQWDTSAVVSLPGTPFTHLNY